MVKKDMASFTDLCCDTCEMNPYVVPYLPDTSELSVKLKLLKIENHLRELQSQIEKETKASKQKDI